ncbi:MAG: CvpA family protein [bacterium]|nr:CvpA family protein [bacterium]MDZ4248280.1 CvpA family protein [Patescibacteria group bacterium]
MVDALIILTLIGYAYLGFRRGFFAGSAEFVGFILGLAIAFALSRPLGGLLAGWITNVPRGILDLGAFMVLWMATELLVSRGWRFASRVIPPHLTDNLVNRAAGTIPGALKGVAFVTILLLILASAPIPPGTKEPFVESAIGQRLLSMGTVFQQQVNAVFGAALRDTLAFKTVKTGSTETSKLGFTVKDAPECLTDGKDLFARANKEREKRGLKTLAWDDRLREVGFKHSQDMLARGYFSHLEPDGDDPFERMADAGITYGVAGENLAFAPTSDIAHTGLMNSPGHKANILKADFRRLGIGCADGGIRGQMYSQEFTG